jgi:hypothetical protein
LQGEKSEKNHEDRQREGAQDGEIRFWKSQPVGPPSWKNAKKSKSQKLVFQLWGPGQAANVNLNVFWQTKIVRHIFSFNPCSKKTSFKQ